MPSQLDSQVKQVSTPDIARNSNGSCKWRSFKRRPHGLKTDLLVGNSGALDICCLIKRSKTHAYMRTLFEFARNCGYLRDSTGFLRANCGLARRRKSTNVTYQRLVSTKMWRKHSSGANSGSVQTQAILAGWELLTEPSGLPNQWPQSVKCK